MENFKIPKCTSLEKPPSTSTLPEADQFIKAPEPKSETACNAPQITNNDGYKIEVLKSGQIIQEINNLCAKPVWKFGRLPENDVYLAHPTVSRFHASLHYIHKTDGKINDNIEDKNAKQNLPEGWYIYDLNSTHGTFLNKERIPPLVFMRMRVGHMIKMGTSTRVFILQGPCSDEEPESELTVTEIREKHQQEKIAALIKETRQQNDGINWGMAEDANEETDLKHNPYATLNSDDALFDDPKRTLRGVFEREGVPLEYKCNEMAAGSFVCRVELPIDDVCGRPIVAEARHKGRKKDCVLQCATEACRILDRHDMLRQPKQEPQKRKFVSKSSDSEDDSFWDRTGDIERKKLRKANALSNVSFSYAELQEKQTELENKMEKLETDITKYQTFLKATKANSNKDNEDLDSFMENICDDMSGLEKMDIRKLRLEQQEMKSELKKLQQLMAIAKPDLPVLKVPDSSTSGEIRVCDKKQQPLIGKRNQPFSLKVSNSSTASISKKEPLPEQKEITRQIVAVVEKEANVEKHSKLSNKPEITIQQTVVESISRNKQQECPPSDKPKNIKHKYHQNSMKGRKRNCQADNEELENHDGKYSHWLPPENQSGDGYTKMNEKFGY